MTKKRGKKGSIFEPQKVMHYIPGTTVRVGPGYFSCTRRCFLCSSFNLFRVYAYLLLLTATILNFTGMVYILFLSFICSYIFLLEAFILFCNLVFVIAFHCFSFFSLSVYRGSLCMYLCCRLSSPSTTAWHCAPFAYLIQRTCLCRSFVVTTEGVSL